MPEENKQELPEKQEESPIDEYVKDVEEKYEEETPEEPLESESEEVEESEEPKAEEEPEAPAEEPEKEPEEPTVPLEEVAEEIKTKTKEEIKQDILKALGMTEEEKAEAKEQGFKFAWEQRGEEKPQSWREVAEENARYASFVREQEETKQAEVLKVQQEEQKKRQDQLNAEWDRQVEYLVGKEYIPAPSKDIADKLKLGQVLTEAERKDPYIVARNNLFTTMFEVYQDRTQKGLSPVNDIVHIYHEYYAPKYKKKPAGADVKVGGGRPAVAQPAEDDMSLEELRAADWEDLVRQP